MRSFMRLPQSLILPRSAALYTAAIFCLTGCSFNNPSSNKTSSTISDATSNTKTDATVGSASITSTAESSGERQSTSTLLTPAGHNTAGNTTKSEIKDRMANVDLVDLSSKLLQYKLDKLPNNAIICSINNVPITFGDYRREFNKDQQQVQASLTYNPQLTYKLVDMAHRQGIRLSPEEREKLIHSTNKMQIGGSKSFNKMLSDAHMSRKEFDGQMLSMGLACKVSNLIIEQNLLNEMINRLLLSQAAKENGFSKEAMNKYSEACKSPQYKQFLATGAFSADDLRNEIINNELCSREIDKIKSQTPLADSELNDFYEKNRGKLRHGARIRLSQIFIALPSKKETLSQQKKGNIAGESSSKTGADTEKQLAQLQKQKYQLAQSLLDRARKGEDFAALADEYSEDPAKRKKDGGDIGLQEESKLTTDFAGKIAKLAAGTVAPEVMISSRGYHVFKVTDKESPGFYRLGEIKGQLKGVLAEQKGKQSVESWLVDQRQKATIVISPELKNLLAGNKLERREGSTLANRHPPAGHQSILR